jgi:hypothetical protein
VWVAIAIWEAKELSVSTKEGEVTTPSVDANTLQGDVFGFHLPQGAQHLIIQVREIPEDMSSKGQLRILETGELAHLHALTIEGGEDGATAGGTKVYGKIVGTHVVEGLEFGG